MTPTTYGQAKRRFARVFGNGTDPADPRVLEFSNYAQEAIMRDLASLGPDGKPWTVRGVYVGGVDRLALTVTGGNLISLPLTHETVLEIELGTASDINNGWFSDLDMSGLVDPDFANDVLVIRQGLDGDGKALYYVPSSTVGNTVQVMAKKRFVAATTDASVLCVPNAEAVADMMVYLQKKQRNDNLADGENYRTSALRSMQAELNGYLVDSTRALFRKAAYLADETTYAPNTLGYIRARLALDLPAGLKVGKTQLTRAINRAVERLVERTNELRTASRLSVKNGLSLLTYTRAVNATDVLPYADWETIRTMVAGSFSSDNFVEAEKRAYDLLEARENNALEILRHTSYAVLLTPLTSTDQKKTLLYYRSKLQLELPNGLRLSDVEMNRYVNEAQREAISQRNSLSATELYSDVDGPSVLTAPTLIQDTDQLVYADFDVIRLLVISQFQPEQAGDLKAQAYALILRNLDKEVKATRNNTWQCLLKLPHYTFGNVRGTIGLGLSEQGYALSDAKLKRMLNEAEENLARTPNFVGGEAEYRLGCVNGTVEMPDDVERIVYADICGVPIDVKHRSFEYIGLPQGNGVYGNCRYDGAWSYWGSTGLQDRGLNEDGNREYFVSNCPSGNLTIIAKRRWMPKKKDTETMLVQNLEALRSLVESKMSRDSKDLATASDLEAKADQAMDRQLDNHNGAATVMPRINMPGTRSAFYRRLNRAF